MKHMRNRHTPKELREKFTCSTCDFISVCRVSLKLHEESHDPNRSICTCHCGKEFPNENRLQNHQNLSNLQDYKFKCNLCPKFYASRNDFNNHMLMVHSALRHKICKACSKGFVTGAHLDRHMKERHGERQFLCSFEGCRKILPQQKYVARRELIHSQLKNHKCDKCPAAYSHSSHLHRHQQTVHLGKFTARSPDVPPRSLERITTDAT